MAYMKEVSDSLSGNPSSGPGGGSFKISWDAYSDGKLLPKSTNIQAADFHTGTVNVVFDNLVQRSPACEVHRNNGGLISNHSKLKNAKLSFGSVKNSRWIYLIGDDVN